MTSESGADRTVTHLFLDLDGTIADPRDGIIRSIAYALTTLNRWAPADEALTRLIGPPLGRVFETLLETDDPALIRSGVDTYRERFGTIGILESRLYPGMADALRSLVNQGFRLYVATSKPAVYAEKIVRHLGLAECFVRVYGPELGDIYESKGDVVRRALIAETVGPNEAILIGDRLEDVIGAKENGIGSVGVGWGYGTREELSDADLIVSTPSELVQSLVALLRPARRVQIPPIFS